MLHDRDNTETFDPGKFYSDSAYTTPAESYTDKQRQRKNILMAMLAGACIMAAAASFIYLFFFYNVVIGPAAAVAKEGTVPNELGIGADAEDFRPVSDVEMLAEDGMYAPPPGPEAGAILNVSESGEAEEIQSTENIYRKCAPSVVSVSVANADFTRFIVGSGIVMSEDGYIVTNTHIVSGAGYINVKLYGGTEYPAYLVGEDPASGLAVIKIEAENLVAAEFGNFEDMTVGENVVSIGNPVEGSFSITDGVISSRCGIIKYGGFPVTVFQTSANCGSGSSGGPIINKYGQVIGIINTDMAEGYGLENLSFAVPVNDIKPIVDELLEHGYVAGRPALGLELIDVPLSAAAYYGVPIGIFVEKVYPESDAKTQGICRGDIIISINGVKISSKDDLNEVKNELSVGDTVSLGIIRKLDKFAVDVVLTDSAEFHK